MERWIRRNRRRVTTLDKFCETGWRYDDRNHDNDNGGDDGINVFDNDDCHPSQMDFLHVHPHCGHCTDVGQSLGLGHHSMLVQCNIIIIIIVGHHSMLVQINIIMF